LTVRTAAGTNPTSTQRQQAEQRRVVYKQALEALEKAGANWYQSSCRSFQSRRLRYILSAEAAAAFDDITRDGRVNQLSGQAPGDWPNTFRTSRFIPAR
jgi:hypothetical protein